MGHKPSSERAGRVGWVSPFPRGIPGIPGLPPGRGNRGTQTQPGQLFHMLGSWVRSFWREKDCWPLLWCRSGNSVPPLQRMTWLWCPASAFLTMFLWGRTLVFLLYPLHSAHFTQGHQMGGCFCHTNSPISGRGLQIEEMHSIEIDAFQEKMMTHTGMT